MKYLIASALLALSLSSFADQNIQEMVGEGKGGAQDCYTQEMIDCSSGCQAKCLEKNSSQHRNDVRGNGNGGKAKGTQGQGDV